MADENMPDEKKKSIKPKIMLVGMILVFLLIVIGGWFYWYEYRPLRIRQRCDDLASEKAINKMKDIRIKFGEFDEELAKTVEQEEMYNMDDFKVYFDQCLEKHGLK